MSKTIRCPNCDKPVSLAGDNKFRPFCSERCRLIDLGEWVQEGYAIPDRDKPATRREGEEEESELKH